MAAGSRCLLADRKKFQQLAPELLSFVQLQWSSFATQVQIATVAPHIPAVCVHRCANPLALGFQTSLREVRVLVVVRSNGCSV